MAKNQYTTVMQLNSLTVSDNGRRVSMGLNMRGDVKVTHDGLVRVYVGYRFKVNSKIREVRLGVYPVDTLSDLRAKRKEVQDLLDAGIDPIEQAKQEREQKKALNLEALAEIEQRKQAAIDERERIKQEAVTKQARITVRRFFDTWQALELRRRKDGGADVLRMFNKDVFPLIGEMALEDVTRAHIQEIVDAVTMRGVVRMNKAVLSAVRQMFNFALDREIIQADPTARIKKAALGKDNERDRVLSAQEIMDLMVKLPKSGLTETAQLALLIQFATMVRISEILGAKWSDIDTNERIWRIPETKNGKSHEVYLSDYALIKLTQLGSLTGVSPYLFPSSRLDAGVCSKTITKQVADRQRGENKPMRNRTKQVNALELAGGHWRPHDLRRTGATMAVELGIPPEAVERCLNHTEQSKIKRIYQRASYAAEKRRAWQMLGDKLARLEQEAQTGETVKVIPLRQA
jgi:integrase